MSDQSTSMLTDEERAQLPELLAAWIPHQRWFGGKHQPVDRARILTATVLREADPRVEHLVLGVRQGSHESAYQVWVSIRHEPEARMDHVLVGQLGERYVYDALHDKDATTGLLAAIEKSEDHGNVSFHKVGDDELPVNELSTVLTVEQSNTSLAFGDAALLKAYRRLQPGINPDVEIHQALTEAGCENVAALLGWVDGRWTDPDTGSEVTGSLAMLQRFLVTATDGWQLATTSVRDLYAEADLHAEEVGGDFAGESHRLGEATATVHRYLAETLETGELGPDGLAALAEQMRRRLEFSVGEVPQIASYASRLAAAIDRLTTLTDPVPVQRVHGDLHLGQTLRTVLGWKLLDFEGEPHEPREQRVALASPLRDVGAMLRSFDYAAQHLLIADHPGDGQLAYRAEEWRVRNSTAFCDGYAAVAGSDPRDQEVLVRAHEIDKAMYELVYEARNRPSWLQIPLSAIDRLAT